MTQTLATCAAEERLRWLTPYLTHTMTLKQIASVSPFSYRTLKRWVKAHKRGSLEPLSRRPHTHPKQLSSAIITKIREMRKTTGLGPDVLVHLLARDGVQVSARGIAKVLKRAGLARTRRRLQKKEKWQKTTQRPGEMVEIDVVYARKFKGKWLYQFTAIDCCSRWRYLWVTQEQSNRTALLFLEKLLQKAPFVVQAIKTDNGSIFTNRYTGYSKSRNPLRPRLHPFDLWCQKHNIVHYLIAPGRPAQNGKVERSHRNDRERFWRKVKFRTLPEVRRKQEEYTIWYNTVCPHLALEGKTPDEFLRIKGTNVYT